MNRTMWVYCPDCGNKTRTMIQEDTELKNFPFCCPKCKQETIINASKMSRLQTVNRISYVCRRMDNTIAAVFLSAGYPCQRIFCAVFEVVFACFDTVSSVVKGEAHQQLLIAFPGKMTGLYTVMAYHFAGAIADAGRVAEDEGLKRSLCWYAIGSGAIMERVYHKEMEIPIEDMRVPFQAYFQ